MGDESRDDLQFEEAEFAEGQAGAPSACALCQTELTGSYYTVNGRPACDRCRTGLLAHFTGGSGCLRFSKAVVFGIVGGLVGAILYWGVARVSGYELSLIAIATGWLTGKGVSLGNGHRGGLLYQLLAVALTWGAICASYVPFMDEEILAGEPIVVEGTELEPGEAGEGLEDSGFATLPTPVRWLIEYPFALALPILSITESPMGFLILLIGLWTAWGTNKPVRLEFTGPHALQPAGAAPPGLPPAAPPPPVAGAMDDSGLPPKPEE